MRRTILLLLLTFALTDLSAQQMSTSFETEPTDERLTIESDTLLFHIPIWHESRIADRATRYTSFVSYSRRSVDDSWGSRTVNLIRIDRANSHQTDYRLMALLRTLPSEQTDRHQAHAGEQEHLRLGAFDKTKSTKLKTVFSQTNYRYGLSVGSVWQAGQRWVCAASAGWRTGRDAMVDGVFDDRISVAAMADHVTERAALSIAAAFQTDCGSSRTPTTDQVFGLAGNNLYNPSWGDWNGRQRSARVNSSKRAIAICSLQLEIDERTAVNATASLAMAVESRSSIGWYDATSPMPDYYTKLPSEAANPTALDDIRRAWRDNDKRYTQIDWNQMVTANTLSTDQSTYIIYNRVERPVQWQCAAQATHRFDSRTKAELTARVRHDSQSCFKQVDDLLGGQSIADVDQYLADDTIYGDKTANDLSNPDRKVGKGDKFGYSYCLSTFETEAHLAIDYTDRNIAATVNGSVGYSSASREGFFDKASMNGNSAGRSQLFATTTASIDATALIGLSRSSRVSLQALFRSCAQPVRSLFVDPQYSNLSSGHVGAGNVAGGSVAYLLSTNYVTFECEAYIYRFANLLSTSGCYDDLSGRYCNAVVSGTGSVASGIEAGVEIALSPRLTLTAAGCYALNRYSCDAKIDLYDATDNTVILQNADCYIQGYAASSSPERTLTAKVRYRTRSQWFAELGWQRCAGRSVEIAPSRRTARVIETATSPENRSQLTAQQQLDPATEVEIYVGRSVKFRKSRLVLTLSVHNLLDSRNTVTVAWEQPRLHKTVSGRSVNYTPFDSKMLYGYPRRVYATIGYEF